MKRNNRDEVLEFDYERMIIDSLKIQSEEQKELAREEVNSYVSGIVETEPTQAAELLRRMSSDTRFEENMLTSVVQISGLILASFWEEYHIFEQMFPYLKDLCEHEDEEIRLFKRHLVKQFNIYQFEQDLGFALNAEQIGLFELRYPLIKDYFK